MKEIPLLFKGEMVRAILDGRKTQTRRMVKHQTEHGGAIAFDMNAGVITYAQKNPYTHQRVKRYGVGCPHGTIGDRLWVRETWATCGPAIEYCRYRASSDGTKEPIHPASIAWKGKWAPSIHMPRWASRITLEITNVRVERVQDITPADIDAEGMDCGTVQSIINPKARQFTTLPEHWISGHDEGQSYCYPCAKKMVSELLAKEPKAEYSVSGGYGTDGDGLAFCETCEKALDNSFTNYACESELDHFEQYGFDASSPSDCYSLSQILDCQIWGDGKLADRVRRISWQAVWNSINGHPKPVMGEDKKISHYVSFPFSGEPRTEQYRGKDHIITPNPFVWCLTFKKI